VDEAEEVDLQTTTGLHTDDYWYGGQTTIRFVCKPLFVRTSNHYRSEYEQLLNRALPQQLHAPITKQSPFNKLSKGEAQAKFYTEHQPLIYRQSLCGYAI